MPRLRWILGLVVIAASVTIASPAPAAAATCSTTSTGGLVPKTIAGGRYLLSVPSGITTEAPLLVALHGMGHTPEDISGYAAWHAPGNAPGYVVAYPERQRWWWDFGQASADVAFIRSVIAEIEATYCIDSSRVHVTGDSLGGYMAQRMACDAPDVVASIGEYAGGSPSLMGSPCNPSRPIAVTMMHGTNDYIVSMWNGEQARTLWHTKLACPAFVTTTLADGLEMNASPCASGVKLVWRQYQGEDHLSTWINRAPELRSRQLAFFATFPHPTR